MKNIMLWLLPLLGVLPLRAQERTNHLFKVFSRYDYYLPGQAGSVICVIPDSLIASGYQLVVSRDGHELSKSTSATGHYLHAPFVIDDLTTGQTLLQYTVLHGQQFVDSGRLTLKRLPAKTNAVQQDRLAGGLITDGMPFFPFGFYSVGVGDLAEKEVAHGFNMVGPYQSNLPETFAERKAYMDRCAQLGVRVQYGVNSLVGAGHNGEKGLDKTEEEKLAIFLPSEVAIYISADGKKYELAGTQKNLKGSVRGEPYLESFHVNIKKKKARYIRIVAKTIGTIPEGYLFKGSTSWLFVDEVLVQ